MLTPRSSDSAALGWGQRYILQLLCPQVSTETSKDSKFPPSLNSQPRLDGAGDPGIEKTDSHMEIVTASHLNFVSTADVCGMGWPIQRWGARGRKVASWWLLASTQHYPQREGKGHWGRWEGRVFSGVGMAGVSGKH